MRENEACPIRACVGRLLFYNRVQKHGRRHENSFMTQFQKEKDSSKHSAALHMFPLDIFLIELTSLIFLPQQR